MPARKIIQNVREAIYIILVFGYCILFFFLFFFSFCSYNNANLIFSGNSNSLQSNSYRNKMGDAAKTVSKPLKRIVTSESTAGKNATTIKTKSTAASATATKITKLVLKPKSVVSKSSLTSSKVTSKKYITKPVAIKSRSTMISHESTFRIQNIKKTLPSERQNEKNEVILMRNAKISQHFIVNGNNSKVKQSVDVNQPFEMVHSEQTANITSLNVTKVLEKSPILQEITSTIVNGSNFMKTSVNEFETNISENGKNPLKIEKHDENNAKTKPRSYDPIKARQLIRIQQEKRKKTEIEQSKTPSTKEEIKQRLSKLRANTLKMVEKNVQKARKNSNINPRNSKSFTPKTIKEQPKMEKQKSKTENSLYFFFKYFSKLKLTTFFHINSYSDTQTKETKATPNVLRKSHLKVQSKVSPSLALTPSKFLPSIKSDKERIGILRRPEGESPTLASEKVQTTINDSVNVEQHPEFNGDFNISPEKSIHNTTFRTEPKLCEFELKAPETIPLKSSLLYEMAHNGVQDDLHVDERNNFEDAVSKPKDIPYWLRPTPVQPYPYNFIMAVRKKLESITHPVVSVKPRKWPNPTEQISFHSPLPRPNTFYESQYRHNLDSRHSVSDRSMSENVSPTKSSDVSPLKTSDHIESAPKQEEYSLDFTSVAVESKHNRSKVHSKSKRKNVGGSQDTLSISSGILSHSSPEKKIRSTTKNGNHFDAWQPSPLTTDNVDGLQITRQSLSQNERISNANSVTSHKSTASSVASHINFGRGKDYSDRTLPSFNKLNEQQSFAQLLDDFKSSLSAAIEANHQLHSLLSNPPSSLTQYNDDFEHISDNEQATGDKNGLVTEIDEVEASHSNASTATKLMENNSSIRSNVNSSKQNYSERVASLTHSERSPEKMESNRVPEDSTTMIEEKIDDYQSSESPTNNDLKSISLSIAKKSTPSTSDDTDQPSNAIESFNKQIHGDRDIANESIGSDIFNIFNKKGLNLIDDMGQSIWSEHNISYSTLGMVSDFS